MDKELNVEAIALSTETVNLSDVETMEEAFAASSDTTVNNS